MLRWTPPHRSVQNQPQPGRFPRRRINSISCPRNSSRPHTPAGQSPGQTFEVTETLLAPAKWVARFGRNALATGAGTFQRVDATVHVQGLTYPAAVDKRHRSETPSWLTTGTKARYAKMPGPRRFA